MQSAAKANVSAIGYHTLWCNGKRVDPTRVMEPGRTSTKHVFFSRFDLAPHLRQGRNVIAASLGNGWEASDGNQPGSTQQPPAFYLDAMITLAHTSSVADVGNLQTAVRVVTNTSWSSGLGAITYNSVYQGEWRDLRLSTPGWQSSTFDASGWQAAELATTDKLLAEQTRPAVVELMVLKPTGDPRKINVSSQCDGAPGCHDTVCIR
jgi:alpha-L-rhamnosidase